MWTQKGKILLFGVISFYVIALVNESLVLYAVCSAGVALLGICYLLARRSLRGLSCRRTVLLDRLVEGGMAPVRVTLLNRDGRTRRDVVVRDALTNVTSGTTTRCYEILIPEVPPYGEATGRGEYACPERGRYSVGPLTLCGTDPLGLFQLELTHELRQSVVAYPRTFDLPAGLLRSGVMMSAHDAQRAPSRGQGHEFRGIREYVEGDDLRWVHWKTTAHLGRLTIKEFESGAVASITVMTDLSRQGRFGTPPDSTVDYTARIASSIVRDSVLRGGFVRLCGNARSPITTPLERGDAHLHRILSILAEVDANGDTPFTALVAAQHKAVAHGSEAVLITAVPDEALTRCVLPLLDNSVGVAVVLLAAHSFAKGEDGGRAARSALPLATGWAASRAASRAAWRRRSRESRRAAQSEPSAAARPYGPEEYAWLAHELRSLGARVAVIESGADLALAIASVVRWHGAGAVAGSERRVRASSLQ